MMRLSSFAPHVDAHSMAYIIMFWEGLGNLFPWNAFITASAYFASRFCSTPFAENFENYFSITATVSQTIGLALAVKYGNLLTLRARIIYPLFWYSAVFALTTVFVVDSSMEPNLLFYLTLLSTCVCGVTGAILSSGLFGLAAVMPPIYTGAVMNGQGLAGLTVSLASVFTIMATAPVDNCTDDGTENDTDTCAYSVDYSALAYFSIATFALLTCVVVFEILCRLPFTHFHLARSGNTMTNESLNPLLQESEKDLQEQSTITINEYEEIEREEKQRLRLQRHSAEQLEDGDAAAGAAAAAVAVAAPVPLQSGSSSAGVSLRERSVSRDGLLIPGPDSGGGVNGDEDEDDSRHYSTAEILRIFNQIKVPAISVWFVFTVTIGLFPSITVLIESERKCDNIHDRFYNDLWTPFFFLLFNLGDFIGRFSASKITFSFLNAHNIWIPVACRVIFFPLFLLCRISSSRLPLVFSSDAWPILIMLLFSVSNGYLCSLCMMLGPTLTDVKDTMLAGNIMIFCLTFGLASGGAVSFLSLLISQGSI